MGRQLDRDLDPIVFLFVMMSMARIWWNRMSSDLRHIARPEYTINKSYVSLQFNHLIILWSKTYHTDQGSIVINPRLSVGKKACIESEQYRQQGRNREDRNDGNQSRRVRWRIWSVEVIYPAHGARSVMSRSKCISKSQVHIQEQRAPQ